MKTKEFLRNYVKSKSKNITLLYLYCIFISYRYYYTCFSVFTIALAVTLLPPTYTDRKTVISILSWKCTNFLNFFILNFYYYKFFFINIFKIIYTNWKYIIIIIKFHRNTFNQNKFCAEYAYNLYSYLVDHV